nr:hypothetical protein Iba_chr14bCG4770 [Ipomoea batatas]
MMLLCLSLRVMDLPIRRRLVVRASKRTSKASSMFFSSNFKSSMTSKTMAGTGELRVKSVSDSMDARSCCVCEEIKVKLDIRLAVVTTLSLISAMLTNSEEENAEPE